MVASAIPNCKAYALAFAGELAVIVDQGMRDMLVDQKDVFYDITMINENYAQPSLSESAAADVIRVCYHFSSFSPRADKGQRPEMRLLPICRGETRTSHRLL